MSEDKISLNKLIEKYEMFDFWTDDSTPDIWWRLNTLWAAPLPLSEENFKRETIGLLTKIIDKLQGGDSNVKEEN